MCGIVACRAPGAGGKLVDVLELLEYRGYDSAGVAVGAPGGRARVARTVRRVAALRPLVAAWDGRADVGVGHTRWATHGAVTEANAHPHRDCTGRIAVVHNGILDDADAVREELAARGHVLASEVDSEAMSHLVEEELRVDGDLLAAVTRAVAVLRGSWAFAVLDAATGRLVLAAHRSPLVVARSRHGDLAASDVTALAGWAGSFRALDDGDVVELAPELVWTTRGRRVTPPRAWPLTMRPAASGLDGHADRMSREIAEQPEVAARILDDLLPKVADGSLWHGLGLPAFERVAVLACGTSLHAGIVVGTALAAFGGVPFRPIVASEAAEVVPEARTLTLAMSQSGETADVLSALARGDGPVLALTNSAHSSLGRRADAVIDCAAGPEVGVAATKTFVAQVVAGVCHAVSALVALDRLDPSAARRIVEDMRRIPDLLAQSLAVATEVVPALAASVREASGFLFLARGPGVAYAAEGALKLKELSYRWAEHYPAGELKHGPLALVEARTPVVVVDNDDVRLPASIAEVEARGGRVIRIGGAGATVPALGRSISRPLAGGLDRWGPLESVVPLQVLARELALLLGRDVDKPRNLAKSVTVE